ncbi:2-dehydropantoate 2-reductase N-terminal domain-containing protein [Desulfosporosinus sp. PR]|uniref:ketopantoate reductase family protein n=1 Tax=Candidatus Desulfosporosinus nitrosoreducens TaxID=3401928 RepID=UPI0027F2D6B7|nr:2-dehydropantoate 2-reductase N-terminal domain-containing protein [Desulfosporosinus sp. PR]MDQ7093636.1 2-dehydropantoate 2-reductase N-terminal domain-containing protein [Desulfosporosinus sp. PR]
MKILFFGRGVIGTQYAWAFENAGHTVEFYVREGRKAQYGSHVNLEIWDARRSKKDRLVKQKWLIVTHEEIKENHDYDLIFMSVNPEQVSSVVKYLAPRVGNATVLFFNNFWQDPQSAIQPIPLSQIVYGFPGAGGRFEENTLYGGLYKTVQFGTFESEPTKRDLEVRKLFIEAGFKIMVQKNPQSWLWNHFALNAAMEVEVLKSGSFEKVISSPEALAGIGRNMKEIIPVLQAKGSKLDVMTKVISDLPPRVVGFLMSNVIFSPKSMTYALVAHNHTKVGYAVQEIISEARKHGIKAPRLYDVESLITE